MRLAFLLLFLAAPSGAVRPDPASRGDAKRFGLDKPAPDQDGPGDERIRREVSGFNGAHRGRWNLRFGALGVGPAGTPEARLSAKEAAEAFLRERGPALGLRPEQLRLVLARSNAGAHHLLFQQVVDGVPVEFVTVKVHLDEQGAVLGMSSGFRGDVRASPIPGLDESAAAQRVAADLGGAAPDGGTLVHFPPPAGGAPVLAWKFRSEGGGGSWVYYVDARDGRILLRYNDLRFASCVTSGTVAGMVFDLDPHHQAAAAARPFRNQRVYVANASTSALTDTAGFYCSQTAGKVFSTLQGPYVAVSNWNGPSAAYNNGGAVWTTFATPLQSPHPYPNNALLVSTINAPAGALMVMPVFSSLDMGAASISDGELNIADNDQLAVLDADGNAVATYLTVGAPRANLHGAAVAGSQLRLRLKSTASGQHDGFSISVSSYLSIPAANLPNVTDNATSTFTWDAPLTSDGTLDEINVFYHLNLMHDYFRDPATGPDKANSAPIDRVVPVMGRAGPNLANAFYDPIHGNLTVGDFGGVFAKDATVVHHEYTHFVVDQIFPIVNFGQFGAISEGLADYFSASSLDFSTIGGFTGAKFGEGPLRELDCQGHGGCILFPANWTGEIHLDGRMLSQALWQMRLDLMRPGPAGLGPVNGKTCADGLVFNALFYFPDSFSDFLRSLLAVSARTAVAVPACGANGSLDGLIQARLADHGIFLTTGDQDVYEPNDGIASATDITTASVISGRIFPNADQDYFALGAGPGRMTFTLTLPESEKTPGSFAAFSMTLIDRSFTVVATAEPVLQNPTLGGNCPDANCVTGNRTLTLAYNNPAANQFYLLIAAPASDGGLVSNNSSTRFYSLSADFPRTGPASAGVVGASFDKDVIDFTVSVSTFVMAQQYSFDHARLRDHALNVLSGSETNGAAPLLVLVSSTSSAGRISGRVQLAPGFADRFPAVGTVHLEVFGVSSIGHVQSMGFSNPLALTAATSGLKAYNNLFNPARGGKATIKWEMQGSGHVLLELFTVSGQRVAVLVDEDRPAGKGSVDWGGSNLVGQRVASGVYILHIQAPGLDETQKIVVVK